MITVKTLKDKIDKCSMSRGQKAVLRREVKSRRKNLERYPKTMEHLMRIIESGNYQLSFAILKCVPRNRDQYPVYFYSNRLRFIAVGFSVELQNLKHALDNNNVKLARRKLQKLKEIKDIYPVNVQPLLDDIICNLSEYLKLYNIIQ